MKRKVMYAVLAGLMLTGTAEPVEPAELEPVIV